MIAFVRKLRSFASALPIGGVLLLENVRLHKKEEKTTLSFAKKLTSVADLFLSMMHFSARHIELMLQLKELPSIFFEGYCVLASSCRR